MRLAFCFLSNKQEGVRNLMRNFNYIMDVPPYVIDSCSYNLMCNPPLQSDFYINDAWNVEWVTYHSTPTLDMFSLRQDSLAMARNADVIFIGDDDMIIDQKSSSTINDACLYMDNNQDCGAIYLCGNLGGMGDKLGEGIHIANSGHLSTNRGILARNRSIMLDNRFHALGANFDFIIGFTCLMHGFYVARMFQVPIEHLTKTRMRVGHENQFYDLDFIKDKGIMHKVNEVLGEWTNHEIWPKEIWKEYRQAAMINGRLFHYDEFGNIIAQ
jgi:hypothetical protein